MDIQLPSPQISASKVSQLNDELTKVYPNAIELGASFATIRGISFLIILLMLYGFGVGLWVTVGLFGKGEFNFALQVAGIDFIILGLLLLIIRLENFNYLDHPTLFNRKTQKVHFFRVKRLWYKPFSHWPYTITTHDWSCVRARIVSAVGGSVNVPSSQINLHLDILESPESKNVVATYLIGNVRSPSISSRKEAWEHIRRYMQGSGVALASAENLSGEDMSSPAKAFETSMFPPNDSGLQFLNLIIFPISIPMAIGAAVVAKTGLKPEWPTEILDAAGGAPLTLEEIRAQAEQELPNLKEEVVEPEHEKWA